MMGDGKLNSIFGITTATLIGFAVTGMAIIIVPLILTEPTTRSEYFWPRIIWTEFLAALVWSYIGGFVSLVLPKHRSIRGLGGILPSLGIVIFLYAISSFTLMMVAAYYPNFRAISLASQVDRFAGLIVVVIFLYFSWITGIAGTEPIPTGIHTPKDLIIQLRQQENALSAKLKTSPQSAIGDMFTSLIRSLKSLRETIQYSIPHVGKIGTDIKYINFSNAVSNFCEDCSKLNVESDTSTFQAVLQFVCNLNVEAQNIAQHLRNE